LYFGLFIVSSLKKIFAMKTPNLLLLLFIFFLATNIDAANYYLAFDPSCVERYEYAYAETRKGNEIVVYVLKVSETEKLFLSVGVESSAPIQPYSPGNLLDCNTLRTSQITRDWYNTVNSKIHQVFIVSPLTATQYRVAQVATVYYYRTDGREIIANTNNFRFHYTPGNVVQSQGDLSSNDVRGSVYYLKDQPYGVCPGYLFRQTNPSTPNRYLDIYVVPSVGIIEETSSLVNTSFKLRTVNGIDATTYLSQLCQGSPTPPAKTTSSYLPNSSNQNEFTSRGAPQSALQTHTVAKGETLYKLSRQFSVTVDQIKTWNGLKSDELRVGTVLYLSPTDGNLVQPSYQNSPNVPNQQIPGSYSTINPPVTTQSWLTTSGTHTVSPGESLADLARQYGYSEERFRFMNGLNAYDNIRPGQLLKTTDCPPPHRNTDPAPTYNPNNGNNGTVPSPPGYNNNNYEGNNNQGYNSPAPSYNSPNPYSSAPSSTYPYTAAPNTPVVETTVPPINPQFTSKGILEDPYGAYRPTEPSYYPAQPSSYEYRSGASRADAPKTMHLVKYGETLESIAASYGYTSSYLRNLNGLDKNEGILAGQQLIIK
jgi:LysM repeat protein